VTNPDAPQKSDPNFDKYPETVLVFEGGLRIDLTRPLTPDDRDRLRDILATPFAVITASDPFGTPASQEENRARRLELSEVLAASASQVVDVRGVAVDGSHAEDGFGCSATVDEAARIAREFRQSAFFWYDGSEFSLVESEGATRVLGLPRD
jgi:hypothetical protein